jgi:hypothetical protein
VVGAWQGLAALYTGTVKDNRVDGTMTWLWPNHAQFTIGTVNWHATIGEALPDNSLIPIDTAMLCASSAAMAKDYRTAFHWYAIAEKEGSLRASVYLGILYVNGPSGVSLNYHEALVRFEAAGYKGDTLGMNNAALIYQRGLGVPVNPQKVKMWGDRMAARRQQLYPICSSTTVKDAMEDLVYQSRNSSKSFLSDMIEGLIAEGMHIDTQDPEIHVAAARTTDVVSDDDFKCDAAFATQKQNVVTPKEEADADTVIASMLANNLFKTVRPVQEFHIRKTGPDGQYTILFEAIGSDSLSPPLRMPFQQPYSKQVIIH